MGQNQPRKYRKITINAEFCNRHLIPSSEPSDEKWEIEPFYPQLKYRLMSIEVLNSHSFTDDEKRNSGVVFAGYDQWRDETHIILDERVEGIYFTINNRSRYYLTTDGFTTLVVKIDQDKVKYSTGYLDLENKCDQVLSAHINFISPWAVEKFRSFSGGEWVYEKTDLNEIVSGLKEIIINEDFFKTHNLQPIADVKYSPDKYRVIKLGAAIQSPVDGDTPNADTPIGWYDSGLTISHLFLKEKINYTMELYKGGKYILRLMDNKLLVVPVENSSPEFKNNETGESIPVIETFLPIKNSLYM